MLPQDFPPPHTQPDKTEDKSDSVCYARFLALSYRRNVCSQTNNAYPCLSDQFPPHPLRKSLPDTPGPEQRCLVRIRHFWDQSKFQKYKGGWGGRWSSPHPHPSSASQNTIPSWVPLSSIGNIWAVGGRSEHTHACWEITHHSVPLSRTQTASISHLQIWALFFFFLNMTWTSQFLP